MSFTYRILPNLPKVPQYFVDRALEYCALFDNNKVVYAHLSNEYKDRKLLKNGQVESSVYQSNNDEAKKNWFAGIKEVERVVDSSWFNQGQVEKGFIGSWSKWYKIG